MMKSEDVTTQNSCDEQIYLRRICDTLYRHNRVRGLQEKNWFVARTVRIEIGFLQVELTESLIFVI